MSLIVVNLVSINLKQFGHFTNHSQRHILLILCLATSVFTFTTILTTKHNFIKDEVFMTGSNPVIYDDRVFRLFITWPKKSNVSNDH